MLGIFLPSTLAKSSNFLNSTESFMNGLIINASACSLLKGPPCTFKLICDATDNFWKYFLSIKAKYLLVSNGLESYCLKINLDQKKVEYLEEIPSCDFFN